MLGIILLNIDEKLWLPLELETINGRNTSNWFQEKRLHDDNIALILFDDKTKFLLRPKGVPIKDFELNGRELINEAIKKLQNAGARSIGLNLNLRGSSNPKSDNELAKTISSYKNIVLADSIYLLIQPKNNILNNSKNIGYGELFAEYDKIVHKTRLINSTYGNIPSFSYELYKVSAGNSFDTSDKNIKMQNDLYLRYPSSSYKKHSFIDLINGTIKPSELKGKFIIIGNGLKSKIIKDELLSPFGNYLADSEVQAIALTNLINNSFLFRKSLLNHHFLFVLFSMILGIIFTNIPAIRGLIFCSFLFASLVIFGQFVYSYYNWVVELVPILFLLSGNFIVGSLIFLQINLQDRNIELENTLVMLNKKTKELGNSKVEIEGKNIDLSRTLNELNQKVHELNNTRKQVSHKREEERKRIARELHDDTLARITDLKRHIESNIYSGNVSIDDKKQLGSYIKILDDVTKEIRRTINALRPSMLDNVLGLLPAIENLLDELVKRSGYKIETKFTTSLSKLKLNESCEIHLYRIVQEALNNVFKHSGASKVEVVLEEQKGQILILVSDNGIGIDLEAPTNGYGLLDMKERASLINANVQYINKPAGNGTTLEITLLTPSNSILEKKVEITV